MTLTTRLWFAAILFGFAAMAALGFVIIGPGRFDPSPPSLGNNPDTRIPGRILYADRDQCLHVVDASGANDREVICVAQLQVLTWIDGDTIAYAAWEGGRNPRWYSVDVATGDTTDLGLGPAPPFGPDPSLEGRIRIDPDGTVFSIRDGVAERIYEADYPEYYQPHAIAISPDEEWVLLQYQGPHDNGLQLWIVALDGSVAGTLVKDVGWNNQVASWWIEGAGVSPATDVPGID